MKLYTYLAPFGFAVFTMGCQTTLTVSKDAAKHDGIPIATPKTHVMGGTYETSKTGKECTPSGFLKTVSLPTGAIHYVNVKGGAFSTSEFNMTMTPEGTLNSIGLNSTPAAKDTIDSLAGVATSVVFPLLGLEPQTEEANVQGANSYAPQLHAGNTNQAAKPLCDTGATKPYIMTLDNFMAITEANRPITQ